MVDVILAALTGSAVLYLAWLAHSLAKRWSPGYRERIAPFVGDRARLMLRFMALFLAAALLGPLVVDGLDGILDQVWPGFRNPLVDLGVTAVMVLVVAAAAGLMVRHFNRGRAVSPPEEDE